MVLVKADIGLGADRFPQRAHDFLAGQVLGMEHPAMAMAALASEVVFVLVAFGRRG